ncbi:helix-turn-helix transcriptional regulator [Agromyces aurantiacus]|uniref:Helix-turn-helix transcriptional regulator n=1 Tax=Agromyces aurantiacus TaxID=165814 RepID=A0ABV9R8W2_9MICO|nr:winged helix-turn-helix domain-containing protein [Agromyces aurantiacus]MBM7503470.1 putative transcriptional regulator [Agromyces aurantiacus]
MSTWTFLTNHGHVLICLARDPEIRVREVAEAVGITERTAQGIIADLVEAGYVQREKDGRRNRYRTVVELPMRHPVESDHRVGELLETLAATAGDQWRAPAGAERTGA